MGAELAGRWIALLVFVSTAAVASGKGFDELHPQDLCNYTIILETTCSKGAGTSDHVSLRFGDSNSNDILVRHLNTEHRRNIDGFEHDIIDDVARKSFRECSTCAFNITGKCMKSKICYMYLKHMGDDVWRPGQAQVFIPVNLELSSGSFYFRRFLPRHVWHGIDACSSKNTPFGMRQKRKLYGNKNGLKSL